MLSQPGSGGATTPAIWRNLESAEQRVSDEIDIEVVEGERALALSDEIRDLCRAVFPDFTDTYLTDRLPGVERPAVVAARGADGALLGFKLGYARGGGTFYSWLGGIHMSMRRQGLGRRLMQRQHAWARERGYAFVETRTRTYNNAMIILNLQSGFQIVGYEDNGTGQPTVTLRAALNPPA
jgi:GNAT superfamily N-acetyltransferase